MNNKNNNYEKGPQKAAHNNENKNVILDRELYKNEPKKKASEEGEEEERHKHGKSAECGCKNF